MAQSVDVNVFEIEQAVSGGQRKKLEQMFGNLKNYLFKPEHSFQIPNLVILACKSNRFEILKYVLSNSVVDIVCKVNGAFYELADEDSTQHNVFYYSIRSNNVCLIGHIITNWPQKDLNSHPDEFDYLLSSSYQELLLNNCPISDEMKLFVESKLLNLRFFYCSLDTEIYNYKNVKGRIALLIDNITDLLSFPEVNEKYLYMALFVAKNIHVLKGIIKSTYTVIPWEEIEFCLSSFIFLHNKNHKTNFFFCHVLTKSKMDFHLKNVLMKLKEVNLTICSRDIGIYSHMPENERKQIVDNNVKQFPPFKELYKDYQLIRDIYSLTLIKDAIKLVFTVDPLSKEGRLVIFRSLQIMGENIKHCLESPKLSIVTGYLLLLTLSVSTRNIVIYLRDTSSPSFFLRKRLENEKKGDFPSIKSDLINVFNLISNMILKKRLDILQNILKEICELNCKASLKEIVMAFKYLSFQKDGLKYFQVLEHKKVNDIITKLESKITATDFDGGIFINKIKLLAIGYSIKNSRLEKYFNTLHIFEPLVAKINDTNQFDPKYQTVLKQSAKDLINILKCEDYLPQFSLLGEIILEFFNYFASKSEEDSEIIKILCEILPYIALDEHQSFFVQDLLKQICKRNAKLIKPSKESNFFYNDQAKYNFHMITEELKDILIHNDIKLELKFSFHLYLINEKLIACVQLLLIDYMSLLNSKNELVNNTLSLDDPYPLILSGQLLLQQLIRCDILVDLMTNSLNQTVAAALNAHNYVIETTAFCKRTQVLWKQFFKPKSLFDKHVDTIVNKLLLFSALENGVLEDVKIAVNNGADLLSRNFDLWTSLHFAAKASNNNVSKYILEQHVNANCRDLLRRSPLHIAAEFGNTSSVVILLKHGFNINDEDDEFKTPLHLAAMNGYKDTVSVLLDKNANLKLKDRYGMIPLHYAVINNHRDVAALLLKGNVHVDTTTEGNQTCLHLASEEGHLDMAKYLVFKGATLNAKNSEGFIPLHFAARHGHLDVSELLICKGSDVNSKSLNGCTPLHVAMVLGDYSIVQLILKSKAEVDPVQTISKSTPLHYASEKGFSDIVNLLLEHGADAEKTDINKNTCLHAAALNNHKNVVEILIQHKVDVNARGRNNVSALHLAASRSENIVNILVKSKAFVNAKTTDLGSTPLHIAASGGEYEIVEILIKNGADINSMDNSGHTPLHSASASNHASILSLLLKNRTNICSYNEDFSSPLHIAVANHAKECVVLLLETLTRDDINKFKIPPLNIAASLGFTDLMEKLLLHGAEVNTSDENGISALDLATEGGHYNAVKLLIKNGAFIETQQRHRCHKILFDTVIQNHKDILEILLAERFFNVSDIGMKALIMAIHFGHKEIVEVLLKNKIDVNSEDNELEDFTDIIMTLGMLNKKSEDHSLLENGFIKPIILACYKGQTEIVEILLANGANSNTYQANVGSPLYLAASLGYSDIVEVLLSYGAEVDYMVNNETPFQSAIAKGHLSVVEILSNHIEVNINYTSIGGWSPLHFAADSGHLEIVSYLVERGCNINSKNDLNILPIHIAAKNGYTDIVEFFFSKGINIEEHGGNGTTLMHFAAMYGHLNVIKLLVSKKANVNAVDFNGFTPLYMAASRRNKAEVDFLLQSGALMNTFESDLFAPTRKLFNSVKHNNCSEVVKSVKAGAVINALDDRFGTVLHYAAWKGFDKVCKILLENKANPNIPGKNGFMPLHYAAKFSHYNTVLSLLSSGAVFNALSTTGKAPIDIATDKDIINQLQIINNCFSCVRNGNEGVLSYLKRIENVNIFNAVMKAQDKDDNNLCAAAIKYKYERQIDLKTMFLLPINSKLFTAEVLFEQGRFDKSLIILGSTLEEVISMVGEYDEYVLKIEELIADISVLKSEYPVAIHQYEKLYTKGKGLLDHKDTLRIKQSIGSILLDMGRTKEGIALLKVISEQQKSFGSDNLDFIKTKILLASALLNTKKYKEALEISTELYNLRNENELIKTNALNIYSNIATCLGVLGKREEAINIFKTVYEERVNAFGSSHPTTIETLSNLSVVLLGMGKSADAFKNFNKVLELQESVLGSKGNSTFCTKYNIAFALMGQRNYLGALKFFKEAHDLGLNILGPISQNVVKINSAVELIKYALNFNSSDGVDYILKAFQLELFSYVKKGDVAHVLNLLSRGVFVNERDSEGRTPLHFGVSSDNVEMVNLLLEYGADVTLTSNKGNTPLHTAAIKNNDSILEILLRNANDTDLNSYLNFKTKLGGTTALHIAAKNGCLTIVKSLLAHGASYNETDNKGASPFNVAQTGQIKRLFRIMNEFFFMVKHGDKGIIKKLEALDHDILNCVASARNTQGKTLIQFAKENSNSELAEKILNIIKSAS